MKCINSYETPSDHFWQMIPDELQLVDVAPQLQITLLFRHGVQGLIDISDFSLLHAYNNILIQI